MIPPKKPNQRHTTVKGRISTSSADSAPSWRFIPLTQGKYAIVDAKNYEWLNQWKWYAHKNNNTYYARRHTTINGKQKIILMHRQIFGAKSNQLQDHRNHNGLDNRINNLRICSKAQNHQNGKPHKNSISKYKGVGWRKSSGKWQVRIRLNKKLMFLGLFNNEIEAARVYDKNALELFGEFAYLNFPTPSPCRSTRRPSFWFFINKTT